MTIEPAVVSVVSLSLGYLIGGLFAHRLAGCVIIKKEYLLSLRHTIASAEHTGIGMIRSYGRLHEAHRVAMETVNRLREDKHLLQQLLARARAGESMGKSI